MKTEDKKKKVHQSTAGFSGTHEILEKGKIKSGQTEDLVWDICYNANKIKRWEDWCNGKIGKWRSIVNEIQNRNSNGKQVVRKCCASLPANKVW